MWKQVNEATLAQGDYLPGCLVPIFDDKFFERIHSQKNAILEEVLPNVQDAEDDQGEPDTILVDEYDLIILTQSCDLENTKVKKILVCSCYSVNEWTQENPHLGSKAKLNEISKGRIWGLLMLNSPTNPDDVQQSLVVDFRDVHNLPFGYVVQQAQRIGDRWRLQSPYLEHLSKTFGDMFARVGLPTPRPKF